MTTLYTYESAAKAYGIPEATLRAAVASGQLKAIKIGPNFVRLREVTIDKWLEGQDRVQ